MNGYRGGVLGSAAVVGACAMLGIAVALWGLPVLGACVVVLGGSLAARSSREVQLVAFCTFLAARPLLEAFRGVDAVGGLNAASIVSVFVVAWGAAAVVSGRLPEGLGLGLPWLLLLGLAVATAALRGVSMVTVGDIARLGQYAAIFIIAVRVVGPHGTQWRTPFRAIVVGGALAIAGCVVLDVGGVVAAASGVARFRGMFAHPNNLAHYGLSAMVPAAVLWRADSARTWRVFSGGLVVAFVVVLLMTGSRSVWLAGIAAALVMAPALGARVVLIVVAVQIGFWLVGSVLSSRLVDYLSLDPSVSSFGFRVRMLQFGLGALRESPWVGVGLGRFESAVAPLYLSALAHNDYLRIGVELGVPGLSLLVGQVALLAYSVGRSIRASRGTMRTVALGAAGVLAVFAVGAASNNLVTGGVVMSNVAAVIGTWAGGWLRSDSRVAPESVTEDCPKRVSR